VAALKEYRAEQEIVPRSDPEAKLGRDLHEAIVSVFETLWPGRAVPGEIQALL
jgi:hypothetical protein